MSKSAKITLLIAVTAATAVIFLLQEPRQTKLDFPTHQPKTTTLFFAGDIMLSRNVAGEMNKVNDYVLPFRNVMQQMAAADIAFANLESPFYALPPFAQQGLIFKADPRTIEGINLAGFDILSTANNHSFDQGEAGINFTNAWLIKHGVLPLGIGDDCRMGRIITKNNIKFGFLAYSYAAYNDGGKTKSPLVCDWNNAKNLVLDIKNLKSQTDYVLVSAHMGMEYKREPDENNVLLAHTAIDAGADFVVGHHPHWVQTIEKYTARPSPLAGEGALYQKRYRAGEGEPERTGWIFYSLGNFVFDQMWSVDTKEGLTVQITFQDKNLSKIELSPVIIEDFCCPRWANNEEIKNILSKINPVTNTSIIFDNGAISDTWKSVIFDKN